jgi:hypothetical protein
MEALGSVAGIGNEVAITAVTSNLLHGNPVVKHCAEITLSLVALGDPKTIDIFCGELQETTSSITRVKAIKALGHVAERGDAKVVKELLEFIASTSSKASHGIRVKRWNEQDFDAEASQCKSSALLALSKVAAKGDRRVMKVVAAAIGDGIRETDCRVAEAAIRSLARLTEKGDKWSIKMMSGVFDVGYICPFGRALKILVLELLADIGSDGDRLVFKTCLEHFQDSDLEVRTQAVRTAGKVWPPGDRCGADKIHALTKGCGDALVRRAAEQAMETIAEAARNGVPEANERPRCTCTMS